MLGHSLPKIPIKKWPRTTALYSYLAQHGEVKLAFLVLCAIKCLTQQAGCQSWHVVLTVILLLVVWLLLWPYKMLPICQSHVIGSACMLYILVGQLKCPCACKDRCTLLCTSSLDDGSVASHKLKTCLVICIQSSCTRIYHVYLYFVYWRLVRFILY